MTYDPTRGLAAVLLLALCSTGWSFGKNSRGVEYGDSRQMPNKVLRVDTNYTVLWEEPPKKYRWGMSKTCYMMFGDAEGLWETASIKFPEWEHPRHCQWIIRRHAK